MINWKKNSILISTLASTSISLLALGAWYASEQRNERGSTTSFLLQKEIESLNQHSEAKPEKLLPLSQGKQLILGGDSWSGYVGARDPEVKNRLQKRNTKFVYQDLPDQQQRAKQLCEGKINLLVTISAQYFQHSQSCGKIVKIIDDSNGGDGIFLNNKKYPSLKSLADLKSLATSLKAQGKKASIVFAKDSPSSYLLNLLSTKFDINLADFELVAVSDATEAWQVTQETHREVALFVLWEPFVTKARRAGYLETLSSRDVPGAIKDVIVASNELIDKRPQTLIDFLEVYSYVNDVGLVNRDRLLSKIATDAQLSIEDAVAVVEGIDFYSSAKSLEAMKNGSLEKHLETTAATLALTGEIGNVPGNFSYFYADKPLEQANANLHKQFAIIARSDPKLAESLQGKNQVKRTKANTVRRKIDALKQRSEIKFDFNSADLSPESKEDIKRLGEELQQFNSQTIEIEVVGHTSAIGDPSTNFTLSRQRAIVVANELKRTGLQHKIVASGKGSMTPMAKFRATDSQQQRTEIVVYGVQ